MAGATLQLLQFENLLIFVYCNEEFPNDQFVVNGTVATVAVARGVSNPVEVLLGFAFDSLWWANL